jgi:hypothetical protein
MKKARELFLLCLIATLAAHLAMTQDDTLFTIFFAVAAGVALALAIQHGGRRIVIPIPDS